MSQKSIYLDHAASTPVSQEVLDVMMPYFKDKFYNPSANYLIAKSIKKDLEDARFTVSQLLGVHSSTITFVAGGSEANNLAIRGVMSQYPDSNLIMSDLEHDSVMNVGLLYPNKLAKVGNDGIVDVDSIIDLINPKTVLISLMLANNEVGTIQPLKKLYIEVEKIRKERLSLKNKLPLYIFADGCQAGNLLDLHINNLKVDLLSLNGSKIYGPKQSGILYVRSGIKLKPVIEGGGQEHNLRSGTENVAFAVAFSKALSLAQSKRKVEFDRLRVIQKKFIKELSIVIPDAIVNGSMKNRLPSNIHITFPNIDNERLLFNLDEHGVMASAGSACSASNHKPSRVLAAMGIDESSIRSSIRLTMGRQTDIDQMLKTISILQKILK